MSENENENENVINIENTGNIELPKRKVGRPRKTYTKEELKERLIHFREYQKEFQKKAYHKKYITKLLKLMMMMILYLNIQFLRITIKLFNYFN